MEKPVRINANEKIRTFNERVRNGLEHALNFMLGTEQENKIQIGAFEPFLMPIDSYLAAYKKKSVMVKIFAEADYVGELYWFFEFKTAVVLGALMRMMPPAAFQEKLKAETFDTADQDAFGEVGNQLCGILDRAFRTLANKNIHLRMDFDKKVYPDEAIQASTFVNKEEYVVFLCTITIPKQGTQKLTLLLPRSLYETMLNIEISLDGITPKVALIYSADPKVTEKLQMQLNSRYVKTVVADTPDRIIDLIDTPNVSAIGIDLKGLKFPLAHQDLIFMKRLVANRSFLKMPYYLTWEGASAANMQEVMGLGLLGAAQGPFLSEFPKWSASFLTPVKS